MTDKITNQQVLGSIMKHPQFLSEVDKYNLDIQDFSSRFEKIIFLAIRSLYKSNATHITPLDIENCIEPDITSKGIFFINTVLIFVPNFIPACFSISAAACPVNAT